MSGYYAAQQIPEDSIEGIQEFWEPLAVLNTVMSEQLMEAQGSNLGAAQMLARVRQSLAQFSFIRTGQTIYYDCKLQHQPKHTFSVGYVCQSDAAHKFCRLHSLRKCVICGGDLAYV